MALGSDDEGTRTIRAEILKELLRRLARRGVVSWRGGKPKGYDGPIELTPGPPISQYILEDRR